MKILLKGYNTTRVYLQKRDLVYLEQTGRDLLTLSQAACLDGDVSSKEDSDFVYFDGEIAYHYFEGQEDIISYDDYLELTARDLAMMLEVEEARKRKDNYKIASISELLMEKEGIRALPYPVVREQSMPLCKYTDERQGEFSLYKSYLYNLFYLEREGQAFYSNDSVPKNIMTDAALRVGMYTFDEGILQSSMTEDKKKLFFTLIPKQNKYEETPREKAPSYWKRFLGRKGKNNTERNGQK